MVQKVFDGAVDHPPNLLFHVAIRGRPGRSPLENPSGNCRSQICRCQNPRSLYLLMSWWSPRMAICQRPNSVQICHIQEISTGSSAGASRSQPPLGREVWSSNGHTVSLLGAQHFSLSSKHGHSTSRSRESFSSQATVPIFPQRMPILEQTPTPWQEPCFHLPDRCTSSCIGRQRHKHCSRQVPRADSGRKAHHQLPV